MSKIWVNGISEDVHVCCYCGEEIKNKFEDGIYWDTFKNEPCDFEKWHAHHLKCKDDLEYEQNNFDYSKTYYKILNKEWNHRDYQYKLGLNIDVNPLDEDTERMCGGGIYFTNIKYLWTYFEHGELVAEITIPSDAKVIRDKHYPVGKWRTDKIFIKKVTEFTPEICSQWHIKDGLQFVDTWGHWGTTVITDAAGHGRLKIVKTLLDINAAIDYSALWQAAKCGHIDVVKLLIIHNAPYDDYILKEAKLPIDNILAWKIKDGESGWRRRNNYFQIIDLLVTYKNKIKGDYGE